MFPENGGELGPRRGIVMLGASAGGLVALRELVEALPRSLQAALFAVMHSTTEYGRQLPEILSARKRTVTDVLLHGTTLDAEDSAVLDTNILES